MEKSKLLKIKFSQNAKKIDSYSQGVYDGGNGPLQVYADDSMFCENCLRLGVQSAAK